MTFVAEEVREILAELGFTRLDEVIGRTDLLEQISRGSAMLDDLDLSPLLVRADPEARVTYKPTHRNEVPEALDEQILRDGAAFFERGEKMQLDYHVRNVHRAIGTRASSHIVRKYGMDGLPEGRLWVSLDGSCGQSLGAFGVKGLTIEVIGDANDYVGKGLSGATIILRQPSTAKYRAEGQHHYRQHRSLRGDLRQAVCGGPGGRAIRGAQLGRDGGGRGLLARTDAST